MKTGMDDILVGTKLFGPEMHEDPYPVYHELRERQPLYWDEALEAWILTAHDDVGCAQEVSDPGTDHRRSAPSRKFQFAWLSHPAPSFIDMSVIGVRMVDIAAFRFEIARHDL